METNNSITIYIVEDNKLFAFALKEDIEIAFENMPVKIKTFETGETCMVKFREENPQVVILDYSLNTKHPDAANGIEVLDDMKKVNPETYVIMLTSNDQLDIAIKSFKHGACDYVVKTDTKFQKIIFSLHNIFKIMEAKNDSEKYMRELKEYKKNSKA